MSNHGNCGRPWTPYEDDLLKTAVAIHGENTEKWKIIALSVPGRTNKACRKRWLHSLSPSVKKSPWTADEDQLLLSSFEKHPNKWSQIARGIPGRTDDACSKRYREALDPSLKKDEWTGEEERHLLDALTRHGGPSNPKWGLIGQELRRSGLGCRNRWRMLQRKGNAAIRQAAIVPHVQMNNESVLLDFLADAWPLPNEDDSSYWTAALNGTVGFGGVAEPHPGTEFSSTHAMPVHDAEMTSLVHGIGLSHSQAAAAFSYPSFIPNGSDQEPGTSQSEVIAHAVPTSNDVSTGNSLGGRVSDVVDFSIHQDDDVFGFYDDCVRNSPTDDSVESSVPSAAEGSCTQQEPESVEPSHRNVSNETDNLSPLGTLAHAASTLTPTPCATHTPTQEQLAHDIVVPPRKRRRAAADSPAITGIHVLSDLVGKRAMPKLSSSLPVSSDSSILAYACGYSSCLLPGAKTSNERFSTSGQLSVHYKDKHMDHAGASEEVPFRCGLKGCNKGWKSINGLQYHLQISKVHYQQVCFQAAAANFNRTIENDIRSDVGDTNPSPDASLKPIRRLHRCTYPGCVKEYKQLSGLRYHLLHGHPKDMPAQLDIVPPRVASQLNVPTEPIPS